MASSKVWYKSRTLWMLAAFVVLSMGLWAQQNWLPDAPLPDWVTQAKDLLFVGLGLWLRRVTRQPLSRGRKPPQQPQETLFDSDAMVDTRAETEPEQRATKAGWNDPEIN